MTNELNLGQGKDLDTAAIDACQEAISEVLVRYNCSIRFEQTLFNGYPAGPGNFRVLKNPPGTGSDKKVLLS